MEVHPEMAREFIRSLESCLVQPAFLERFYELFLDSSPEVAEKFRDTDFERQRRALTSSLYVMVMALERRDAALAYLEQIAQRHSREQLDIRPELYEAWLDCLVRAAGEFDPEFSDATAASWHGSLRFGIDFMRERYSAPK